MLALLFAIRFPEFQNLYSVGVFMEPVKSNVYSAQLAGWPLLLQEKNIAGNRPSSLRLATEIRLAQCLVSLP